MILLDTIGIGYVFKLLKKLKKIRRIFEEISFQIVAHDKLVDKTAARESLGKQNGLAALNKLRSIKY